MFWALLAGVALMAVLLLVAARERRGGARIAA
jgi:hypothetical protein